MRVFFSSSLLKRLSKNIMKVKKNLKGEQDLKHNNFVQFFFLKQ